MKLLTQWAITSSFLILIVLAVRALFRDKLSARLRYALWGIVLLRLLVPFQVELPAQVSDSVPLLVSNAVPEVDDMDLYAFRTGSQTLPEDSLETMRRNGLEAGNVVSHEKTFRTFAGIEVEYDHHYDVLTETGFDTYFLSLPQLLILLWAAGAGLVGAAILLSNLRFAHRLRKRREPLGNPHPSSPAAMPPSPKGEGLALRGTGVPVYTVEGLPSPCLFGVLRPAVYVTRSAAEDPDTLRHVLAHELTHYRHKDHLWSLLRCLALALHWYNPLVWLAAVLSKGDGELACDEGAVARLGEGERIPYGRTLVDMVAKRSLRPVDLLSCSTAMTGGESSIKRRVAQIVKKPETVKAALFAVIALVALSAVFVFAGRAQADGAPRDFQGYLDMTTGIHYYPSLYSSTLYPDPITDPELLSQAKEVLSGVAYLNYDDPQPDLDSSKLLGASRISLPNGVQENKYTLLWQNDRTYLLPGDPWTDLMELREINGETAQLVSVSGTLVSKPGVNVASVLERLAREQSRMYMDPKPMTPAELADWNRLLLREQKVQLQGRPHNRGTVEFHAGYTSETKGTVDLWYWGDATHDGVWVLSLEATGPDSPYTILNDQPIVVYNAGLNPERYPEYTVLSPEAFAAALRPGDISEIILSDAEGYYLGRTETLDRQVLKDRLTQALYHQFSDEYDQEKYGMWTLTVRVKDKDGQPYVGIGDNELSLSIGRKQDVVCLYHQNFGYDREMSGRAYVYSPEVYETILSLHEQVPDMRDLTAEQVAQINEAFRPDVQRPDGSWGPSEISCFFTSSYDDPTQIDLKEFLAYCPLWEGVDEQTDREEYRNVLEATWPTGVMPDLDDFLLPTPMWRYPREKVNALLEKYTWTAVEHLDQSNCLYLEKYDAFYNFTSDFGPGFFHCEGGEISEDTVRLWSEPDGEGNRCELTLRKNGENWLIQSHHTVYER